MLKKNSLDWLEILEYYISSYPIDTYQPTDVSIVDDYKYEEYFLKLIMIGDQAVGKTSIRGRYLGLDFSSRYLPTIGADLTIAKETLGLKKIRFQIWDLAGQSSYHSFRSMYYNGAKAALVVCDVSNQKSVTNIVNWVNELWKNNGKGPIPFMILGNKIDLRETEVKCVKDQELQKIADGISAMTRTNFQFQIPYLPTSAKTGENITKAFQQIALQALAHRQYLRNYEEKIFKPVL